MPAQLAILLCSVFVAILFYLDRNRSVRISRAVWLPTIWISLAGSRPVSMWFGAVPTHGPSSNVEGSPLEATIYGVLLLLGVAVLSVRARKTRRCLLANSVVGVYFIFCLVSVTWSPVPVPALKRWLKDVGDVVMVMVVCTEAYPLDALRQLFTRVALLIFPLSIVLIRYTIMGRSWDADGRMFNVGVTDNKNTLGLIVFTITLGVLWNLRRLLADQEEPNRRSRLIVAGTLFVCGVWLLAMAGSSTSIACFAVGAWLMLTIHLKAFKRHPSRVYGLCLALLIGGGLVTGLGGAELVANALGRDASFSGRTEIWAALIPAARNPLIGVGFESFWDSPNVLIFYHSLTLLGWYFPERLNEAHSGYLETYLNLGWIGIGLIALILMNGLLRARKVLWRDRELGSLMLTYIVAGLIYNVTECGFRTLNPMWIFILMAVVSINCANVGLISGDATASRSSRILTKSNVGNSRRTEWKLGTHLA